MRRSGPAVGGTATRGLALYERIVSTIGPKSAGFAPTAVASTASTTTASTSALDGRALRLAIAARSTRSLTAFTDLQSAIAATNAQGRLDPSVVEKLLARL